MKPVSLAFQAIEIRRMPGFVRGGFSVDGLSPGVNVIYGPNASGKTTLARAMRRLLWPQAQGERPDEIRQTSLVGELGVDGNRLRIELDAGHVQCQRNGAPADPPLVGPAESRDRYLLALHELLGDESRQFAEQIARESAGGYDVPAAAEALDFRAAPPRAGTATNAVRQRRGELRQAREAQLELLDRQQALGELARRRDEAIEAEGLRLLVEQAINYAQTSAQVAAARQRVEAFPGKLAQLKGDERDKLARYRERGDRAAQQLRDAEQSCASAERQLASCGLAAEGLPAGSMARLRAMLAELDRQEGELQRHAVELRKARAEREVARRWLGPDVADDQLSKLEPPAVDELLKLARLADELRARKHACEAQLAQLTTSGESCDAEQLRAGIDLLERWRRESVGAAGGEQRLRWLAVITGACMAIAGALGGLLSHPAWFVLSALGCAAAVAAWFVDRRERRPTIDAAEEFSRLGLDRPKSWNSDDVDQAAREFARRWSRAVLDAERTSRRRECDATLAGIAREEAALAIERDELGRRLGLTMSDDAAAAVWVDHLLRWQRADGECTAEQAALEGLQAQRDAEFDALRRELGSLGYEIADRAGLAGAIEDLGGRHDRFQKASAERQSAQAQLHACKQQLTELADEHARWLASLGLSPGDEEMLVDLCRQHEDYLAARRELERLEVALTIADTALAAEPGLKERPPHELAVELRRAEEATALARSASEEIGRIQEAIEAAKSKSDVEELLTREEAAADALRELRTATGRAVVGDLLAAHLNQQAREQDRPAVFRRARELFARITHGRYVLELDAGDPPCFRAIDASTQVGHALDELSSGTRLQLLLAVRVAFVERQEHGPKLPLVFDETLGNSDERRADEIIDAALEICRDGRQLFYFTAQHDEVLKWRRVLSQAGDVPHAVIDLAERRGFSEAERLGRLEPVAPQSIEIPAPEGYDHAGYARRLGVPAFDPAQDVHAAHVWYVCESPGAVHELLRLGINNWGQLATLVRVAGARPSIGGFELDRAEAAAQVLARIAELRRTGRGRPVDRAALLESQAVTKQFLDDVADLAEQLQGDARLLLEAIENKAIRGFRAAACALLREFFVREGYLDEREPLAEEELRVQVLASAMQDLNAGWIDVERINQLLACASRSERCLVASTTADDAPSDGATSGRRSKTRSAAVDASIGDAVTQPGLWVDPD